VAIPSISISDIMKDKPGYILQTGDTFFLMDTFKEKDSVSLYKNATICKDLGYDDHLISLGKDFETSLTCDRLTTLSLFKGYHMISLTQSHHDLHLVTVITGSAILYLINPKHSSDIKDKKPMEVKKWTVKIVMKPGSMSYIPPNWFYFYECKGESIIGSYESDIYTTWIYNSLR